MMFAKINDTIELIEEVLNTEWKKQTWAKDKKKAYVAIFSLEVDIIDDPLYIIKGNFGIKDAEYFQFELIVPDYADASFIAGMFSQYIFNMDSERDTLSNESK